MRHPAIYIMSSGTNANNGTLYIGVTSNLIQRVWQHRNDIGTGFAQRHRCRRLVYFEQFTDMTAAITREKQLKDWSRSRKQTLIASNNPTWRDLYNDITQ